MYTGKENIVQIMDLGVLPKPKIPAPHTLKYYKKKDAEDEEDEEVAEQQGVIWASSSKEASRDSDDSSSEVEEDQSHAEQRKKRMKKMMGEWAKVPLQDWDFYDYWMEYMELGSLSEWLHNRMRREPPSGSNRPWNDLPSNPPAGAEDDHPQRVVMRHQAEIPGFPNNMLDPLVNNPRYPNIAGGERQSLRYPDKALWTIFLDRE
jgi:hypothetical protein